jgi:nitrite reductase (NADH) large subunit
MNMIADPRERLVIIGNGMAGMRTVAELLKRHSGRRYCITVFGAEPHVNYDRILLSSVLAGDKSVEEIVVNSREWYDENGIRLFTSDAITAIDRKAKTVTAASGRSFPYDRLLIRDRLASAGASHTWARSARRLRLPRYRRCRQDAGGRANA